MNPKCPGCKRKTYSAKWDNCSVCGYSRNTNVSRNKAVSGSSDTDGGNTAVSGNASVSPSDTKERNAPVSGNSAVSPGEVCSQCGERKPKRLSGTERVREWRKNR